MAQGDGYMKNSFRLLALLLILVLLSCLAACTAAEPIQIEELIGLWRCPVPAFEALERVPALNLSVLNLGEPLKALLEDISVTLTLELRADGNYYVQIDTDSADAAAASMLARLRESLPRLVAEQRLVSEDALMRQYENVDALIAEQLGVSNAEALSGQLRATYQIGQYELRGNRLHLKRPPNTTENLGIIEYEPCEYNVKLRDGKLTIQSDKTTIGSAFGIYEQSLPLAFVR